MVADNSELAVSIDPCPSCETTTGVQRITNTPPTVQAWSCTKCGTDWAISVVNPLLRSAYLAELAATKRKIGRLHWTLRQIFALAGAGARNVAAVQPHVLTCCATFPAAGVEPCAARHTWSPWIATP